MDRTSAIIDNSSKHSTVNGRWRCCSNPMPKAQFVYITQVLLVYVVVFTALANLSLGRGSDFWLAAFTTAVAYLLPPPKPWQDGSPQAVPAHSI